MISKLPHKLFLLFPFSQVDYNPYRFVGGKRLTSACPCLA